MEAHIDYYDYFDSQTDLAKILAEGEKLTNAIRVKAHRIWKGKQQPSDADKIILYQATNGKLTPNDFIALPKLKKKPKQG